MDFQLQRFFLRNNVKIENLLYVQRNERKAFFYFKDGTVISNFMAIQDVLASLPEEDFLSISRSVIVSKNSIVNVEKGYYTMSDGTRLKSRDRTYKAAKEVKNTLPQFRNANQKDILSKTALALIEQYKIYDNYPLAFCILELSFNSDIHGIDLVFRYCNDEMVILCKKNKEEIVTSTLLDIMSNLERHLVTFADVALNGIPRYIETFDPTSGQNLKLYCFQPAKGFCACTMASDNSVLIG